MSTSMACALFAPMLLPAMPAGIAMGCCAGCMPGMAASH